jgi:pimeloyl-ACP methyl ester carboxylesterase
VNESTSKGAENKKYSTESSRAAIYDGGHVEYSVIGTSDGSHNAVIIIPGFTGGRLALRDFARTLSEEGDREVILPDQPVIASSKLPVLDAHAEALLSVIESEGLIDEPVDFIAHSFGSIIAARAAELAKQRGIKSLDSNLGSHMVFIAPAGSNDKESLARLGGRWAKFIVQDTFYRGELDPDGTMSKAGVKNFFSSPSKTVKEIAVLSKKEGKEDAYASFGKVGLRPYILSYARDDLYPYKVTRSVLERNAGTLLGSSVPIDSGGIGAGDFKEFKSKSGLGRKKAFKAWAHHYRNANHADLQYHPERTVKAILQIWQDPDKRLEELKKITL